MYCLCYLCEILTQVDGHFVVELLLRQADVVVMMSNLRHLNVSVFLVALAHIVDKLFIVA